ncbi:hypothetical protein E4U55_007566 [Claviceps digitariae]|nr:hypothetical protein E4U55_007566 [Claviceps digitariae]
MKFIALLSTLFVGLAAAHMIPEPDHYKKPKPKPECPGGRWMDFELYCSNDSFTVAMRTSDYLWGGLIGSKDVESGWVLGYVEQHLWTTCYGGQC